jgi:nucleoside-triphosphatase THEP1
MAPRKWRKFWAGASGQSRQINITGDNFGPINMSGYRHRPATLHQLPMTAPDFRGRDDEIAQALSWLSSGPMPRIMNIYGPPGIGKSALATNVANTLSGEFPDIQLYIDLRPPNGIAADPDDVLAGILTMLGVPAAEIPVGLALRSSIYRSLLAQRKAIVLLDNAQDSRQVLPLIPGPSQSVAIITSWVALGELPGSQILRLEELPEEDALELLTDISQRSAENTDHFAMNEIVRLCDGLPLALRIAGGLIKSRPHWSWQDLAARLQGIDGLPRIERFSSGYLAVDRSFELAYQSLPPEVAHGFRLLSLVPSSTLSSEIVSLLLEAGATSSEDVLDQLLSRQLLQPSRAHDYRMHELLRVFAQRKFEEAESQESKRAAVERLTRWFHGRIRSDYFPAFLTRHANTPLLEDLRDVPIASIYIDTKVQLQTGVEKSPYELFPSMVQRLAIVASGGTGKTTLVNQLCSHMVQAGLKETGHTMIPFMLLARDFRPADETEKLEGFILRTLRYQYNFPVTLDFLSVVMSMGKTTVVLDGLDEVANVERRRRLLEALREFCARRADVPIIVTSRYYSGIRDDLKEFEITTLAPWTGENVSDFLRKVTQSEPLIISPSFHAHRDHRNLERSVSHIISANAGLPDLITTPLGLLLSVRVFLMTGQVPSSRVRLVEAFIDSYLYAREQRRGLFPASPHFIGSALEHIALSMQSSNTNRIYIRLSDLAPLIRRADTDSEFDNVSEIIDYFRNRVAVFNEVGTDSDGEALFAFAHTLLREHFSARNLAGMHPRTFADVVEHWLNDGSWQAVVLSALELRRIRFGEDVEFLAELDSLAKTFEPSVRKFIRDAISKLQRNEELH